MDEGHMALISQIDLRTKLTQNALPPDVADELGAPVVNSAVYGLFARVNCAVSGNPFTEELREYRLAKVLVSSG